MFLSWAPRTALMFWYSLAARPTLEAAVLAASWTAAACPPKTDSTAPALCCNSLAESVAALPIPARAATAIPAGAAARLRPSSRRPVLSATSSSPLVASFTSETTRTLRMAVFDAKSAPPFLQ
nr:MAG TPA: hypothetical protein [Caudoviricetes sp.]